MFAARLVGAFRQGARPSREGSAVGRNSPQRLPWSKSVLALCQASIGVALVTAIFKNPICGLSPSSATSFVVGGEVRGQTAGVNNLSPAPWLTGVD